MLYDMLCEHGCSGVCKAGEGCSPIERGWAHECPRMAGNDCSNFNPAKQIMIRWDIKDVREAIEDYALEIRELSEEELLEVLYDVEDNHDASYGVTWATLAATADMLFGKDA